MKSALRSIFLGRRGNGSPPLLAAVLAVGGFTTAITGYALNIFGVSGGIVFVPLHAAVLGMGAACLLGGLRRGLLFAWVATYAALLGYHAEHAFFGLPGRTLGEQFAHFLEPDGLAVLALMAVVFGTLAFVAGSLARLCVDTVRGGGPASFVGESD